MVLPHFLCCLSNFFGEKKEVRERRRGRGNEEEKLSVLKWMWILTSLNPLLCMFVIKTEKNGEK